MEHRNQLQSLASNPVGDAVGGVRDDQLAGSNYPAGAAHLRVALKKIHGFEEAFCDECRTQLRVFLDTLSQADKMLGGAARPHDLHRGAFNSPGFLQESSHFDTFSWPISCPES